MKIFRSKRLSFILYVAIVLLVMLIGFNVFFTIRIHNQLAGIVKQPGKWPPGSYIYDPVIGFDFAPGISAPIGDGSFYVKSHRLGYRIGEHEDAEAWAAGGVLSLGCSFTYGDEVESEQTFTQVLADSLSVPAYNYGISSFSYVHALLKARNLKEQGVLDMLKPAYVVLGCWYGLPNRTRSPKPPIASKNIPFVAAHLVRDAQGLQIHPPSKTRHAFDLINLYRKEGPGLSFRKFAKIFFIAPQYLHLFLTGRQERGRDAKPDYSGKISDFEVYDYYFTAIEDIFSPYGSRIIVLYMPNSPNEKPGQELLEAVSRHPGIIFVNGQEALTRYGVPASEFQAKHPQPAAHGAYARAMLEILDQRK